MPAKENQYAYGLHTCKNILLKHKSNDIELYVSSESILNKLYKHVERSNIKVKILSVKQLTKITGENVNHQGVVIYFNKSPEKNTRDLQWLINQKKTDKSSIVACLDCVQDPHNIGAVIRSAAAFGIKAVIVSRNKAPKLNATIMKVACGASEHVPLIETVNIAEALILLQKHGYWIYGFDGKGEQELNHDTSFDPYSVIVLGSEDKGMRTLVRRCCDYTLRIPMHALSQIDSINVSNAAAIAFFMTQANVANK